MKRIINNKHFKQLVRFGIVGVCNTAIDYTVYLIMTRIFVVYFLYSNFISMGFAMIFSFFANKHFTFRNKDGHFYQFLKFITIQLIGFVIANSIIFILVHYFNVYDIYSKIIASVIFTIWNFLAQKFWAFKMSE